MIIDKLDISGGMEVEAEAEECIYPVLLHVYQLIPCTLERHEALVPVSSEFHTCGFFPILF